MALDEDRRARIVQAATALFSSYGYRRTSMDELARQAGVAKPTLYAYFEDKQSVFSAVVDDVLARILDEARSAADLDADLESRLVGVLAAKFTRMHELVHASPHAADLLASSETTSADAAARTDAAYRGLLLHMVSAAARSGELDLARASASRPAFVNALLCAGHGAGYGVETAAQHRHNLATQVHLLLVGAAGIPPGRET